MTGSGDLWGWVEQAEGAEAGSRAGTEPALPLGDVRSFVARNAVVDLLPPKSSATRPGAFSVWEQLAGDPGAQALRAQWESRWDEF
jgi:hypothetical protein